MIQKSMLVLALFFTNFALSGEKTHSRPKADAHLKSSNKSEKEGTLDLSSEIKQSINQGKEIGTVAGSVEKKKEIKKEMKKKTKHILRVEAGPTETVQVPDNMDWDHNKKTQDQQIKRLQKELDGGVSNDPDDN